MSSLGGGIMGLGQQLMGLGLGMAKITGLARETIAVAREHAGSETVTRWSARCPASASSCDQDIASVDPTEAFSLPPPNN